MSHLVCSEQVIIMAIELSFQEHTDYLFVRARGAMVYPDVREALLAIQEKVKQTGHTRILIDGMGFTPPRADIDRFLIGESIAELLGQPLKVAVFGHAEYINKLAENTAVNRGASFYVVGDEAEALRWLLADLPAAPPPDREGV